MSAKPEASEDGAAPAKSKKMLIIILAAVLVIVLGGGGAFFMMKKKAAAEDEEGVDAPAPRAAAQDKHKLPPVYLPMDNMVVNLANPGGERVAQIGVTLEVLDEKAALEVKSYMPTIRSGVLMLVSKRTAEELLSAEGKEKLAEDILRETSIPFGGGEEEEETSAKSTKKKKKVQVQYPVVGVHFSSFIVQ